MRAILALTAFLLCAPAKAQEASALLPDTVVTATRIGTPNSRLPGSADIVDRDAIQDRGYNSLADALSDLPGLHVSPSGSLGGQTSVFIRGTNSGHVLVLRDGMPINDPSDPSDAFEFGVDTLSDIERIEVVRGPMAALYGSGAIGGVINLISRRGTEPGVRWDGDLSGGYPGMVRGAVAATGMKGPLDFAVTLASQYQVGFDSTPQRMTTYSDHPQGFRDQAVSMNLGYTPVEGTRLSLFLRARQAAFHFDADQPSYDSAASTGTNTSLLGRIGAATTLFGVWDSDVYYGYQHNDRRYLEPLDAADPNLVSADDRYHSSRNDVQWNNRVHLDQGTDATFGAEWTGDTIAVRLNDNGYGAPSTGGTRASMNSAAVYSGFNTMVWDRITLTGQVRQDWVAGNTPTTWRAGASFDAREIDTVFKASYGTAFRAPSLYDRFGVDSYGFQGNPTLRPERARGWEVGFATAIPASGQKDFVSFGSTYFNEQVDDLITYSGNTEVNIGSAHLQGLENSIGFHPGRFLSIRLSHTYTQALNVSDGTQLHRRPQNTASLSATVQPIPALKIVPTVEYTGAFRDTLYDNGGNWANSGTSPQGLLAHLAASYELTENLKLYAVGKNLFGSRFEAVNGYQVPGTSVIVGVRVSLGP